MKINQLYGVEAVSQASGLIIIVDVLRASSTAAYAFAKGAEQIIPVSTLKEAYDLKALHPDYILVGENNGEAFAGTDFGNSPSALENVNLRGKTIVLRTTQGTQGLMNCPLSNTVLFGSFLTAKAMQRFIEVSDVPEISLVALGGSLSEDAVFTAYFEKMIRGKMVSLEKVRQEMRQNIFASRFFKNIPCFPEKDFWLCFESDDKFNFILKLNQTNRVLERVDVPVK